MKIEYSNSAFKDAKFIIEGFPYDRTSSFIPGSRFGPHYIRFCTENIEWYSPYQKRSVADLKICDLGDLEFTEGQPIKEIEREVRRIYSKGKTGIFLGGEHTISYPITKAIHSVKGRFSVIHFDAHADLRDEFSGEKVCHACAIRRVSDVVGFKNIYQFGIRSGTEEEFKMHKNLFKFDVYKPLKKIMAKIKDPIYLTIDVDVVDPSELSAVATPEPGGISFRELVDSLLLLKSKKIIGADIVEYNPLSASPWASGSLVADILRELLLIV
ncbi:MAG TPA: agmatinase [bacterium]